MHIDIAVGKPALPRLEAVLVPAAESHFAVASAVPKEGIPPGASDNLVVAVVVVVVVIVVLDNAAGDAFD